MRFFDILDYQHLALGVFLGLATAVIMYLAFRTMRFTRERESSDVADQNFEYPDGLRGKNHSVPPVLIFLYAGFVVWLILYVLYIGLFRGEPI
jgi:hypothetical protein